jgi:hypothetical protein
MVAQRLFRVTTSGNASTKQAIRVGSATAAVASDVVGKVIGVARLNVATVASCWLFVKQRRKTSDSDFGTRRQLATMLIQ